MGINVKNLKENVILNLETHIIGVGARHISLPEGYTFKMKEYGLDVSIDFVYISGNPSEESTGDDTLREKAKKLFRDASALFVGTRVLLAYYRHQPGVRDSVYMSLPKERLTVHHGHDDYSMDIGGEAG